MEEGWCVGVVCREPVKWLSGSNPLTDPQSSVHPEGASVQESDNHVGHSPPPPILSEQLCKENSVSGKKAVGGWMKKQLSES